MPTPSFKEILIDLLKKDTRLVDEQGDLRENLVHEYANELDPQLIELLLNDSQTRERFFLKIKDVYVFKQNDFRFFLDENKLDNSYTQYENKIGLSFGSRLLRETSDVVLNFPYNDCILEGGQSTEEGNDIYFEFEVKEGDYVEKKAKRKEVFFNQILARDEIDRLLEPKAFTNIKHFTKNGEEKLNGFTRDENGTIKDNLIIKGNNLLALHSLKQEFRGKVKLIYIDPPYNTGNDSFAYNDNFNHSTWLTFMKNRLEVARELLREDGVIFVQCDDNEQAYLKVLMDDKEMFGNKNFVETYIWKNTDNAPSLSKKTRKNIEFIHCYEKNYNPNLSYIGKESENDDAPLLNSGNPVKELSFPPNKIKFNIPDGVYEKGNSGRLEIIESFEVKNGLNSSIVKIKGEFKWSQRTLDEEISKETYFLIKTDKMAIRYQRKEASDIAPEKFLSTNYLSKALGIETNEDSKKHIDVLNLNFSSYPKPESLISFLIKAVTKEEDIVLDYHIGSGTTASTAHKMNRQYIGIEQIDYIENVTVERLKKVIDGEQGGISKAVNWQGGGSFIYLELAKNNQNAIEQIEKAESLEALNVFFEEMCEKYFLHYNVKIKAFREKISKEGAFIKLPLARQKEIYARMLDLNQLYVNVSDMQDSRYALSKEDISLTNVFYKNGL